MSIIGSNTLAGASGQATGYNLNNSLRFRSSNSANLARTPASATNKKTWTWSGWVKRGALSSGSYMDLFSCVVGPNDITTFRFHWNVNDDALIWGYVVGGNGYYVYSTNVFRDPSAWYHIMCSIDTTQATSTNRVKIYVNGVQVTQVSAGSGYPLQNVDTQINATSPHNIGCLDTYGRYFDGYMTEINFVDGSALTPSSFGETSATTGSWIPKKYTGSYGTNGFYLKFADASAATAAAIGKDSSGNGNNWTPSGISVTAGVTYDAMTDVPTNTSATVANYATLSAIDYKTTAPSNGGLTEVAGGGIFGYARATQALPSSNKTYVECKVLNNVSDSAQFDFGVATNDVNISNIPTTNSWVMEFQTTAPRRAYSSGSQIFSIGGVLVAGDTCQIAFDMSTGNGWMGVNNVWYNSTGGTTGDPSTGVNPTFTGLSGLTLFPVVRVYGQQVDLNFGQRTFTYTPPTGFVRLNTYNLPTPTILQGNKYMDATTYTGTGAALNVTNAGGFKPDFVWVKDRGVAQQHLIYDSIRGVYNFIGSSSTAAESTNNQTLTSFNSNGFGLGTNGTSNSSAGSFVGWQWQAGQGTTSSNTSGSITSTVSVNATAGFSIATFTTVTSGTSSVGHGLGVIPKFVIFKARGSTSNWICQHTSTGIQYLTLNGTGAATTDATVWNSAPTSSIVNMGTGFAGFGGATAVMYCWAEIAGFSKFGSYTGNGSANGPFVYTGFRPKFVMMKCTTAAAVWTIIDSTRDTYNASIYKLSPNSSSEENNTTDFGSPTTVNQIDILSNGFKQRGTDGNQNANGQTYIYMAFAENPFKNANAR